MHNKKNRKITKIPSIPPAFTREPAPSEFLNRDLSWLEFNFRVLQQARDGRIPLLERVRFLSIFSSNLDEFVMKRIGGLMRQLAVGVTAKSVDGMSPAEQLIAIRDRIRPLLKLQSDCYHDLVKLLAKEEIHLLSFEQLNTEEQEYATQFYRQNIFPILTPLAVDPGHPFPFISNLSTSLGLVVQHPGREEMLFARVKIPKNYGQWLALPKRGQSISAFVSAQSLIQRHLGDLFPGMSILEIMPFRVTRNMDLERDEEDAEDLMEMIEQELRQRRFAQIIRLEVGTAKSPLILKFLTEELELKEDQIFELEADLEYTGLKTICDLPYPHLKFEPWSPTIPPRLQDEKRSIFDTIRESPLLVHHPYESFSASVEQFIHQATEDPKVLAIKMALYRTGDNSPFIKALIRAAERDKHVICLIELKARFDEERNIHLAEKLENAGVHVVYGVVGLKTHAKVALVIRQEGEGLRCYAHLGTGNYHTDSARLYTDLGLLTSNEAITEDLVDLFHYLTGRSLKRDYRKLLVAPVNMKERFLEMVKREAEHAIAGRPAQIIAKCNSLEDYALCKAMFAASQQKVDICLYVRGFCCIRPGVPNVSERIRVISVIGRFLEHSRIFYFRNGQADPLDGEFYMGSADWMGRNLHGRVEVVVPIEEREHKGRLWEIFEVMRQDKRLSWEMQSDGTYIQNFPDSPENGHPTHQTLMNLSRQKSREG